MDVRPPDPPEFYITACDRHGRSPARESLVAGDEFTCESGYPALPFGCGHPSFIPFSGSAPRWLVLIASSGADIRRVEGGARVYRASIALDGDKESLCAYLRDSPARRLPHVFRRLDTNAPATFAGGFASTAHAGQDSWLVGSGPSELQAGHASTCVTGAKGKAGVADLGVAVAGPGGSAAAGQGGVAVTWGGGQASAGAGGLVVADAPAALEVGPMGLAVGTRACRFRGGDGAHFIVRHADPDARNLATAIACVGIAGIKPDLWYAFNGTQFLPIETGPTST